MSSKKSEQVNLCGVGYKFQNKALIYSINLNLVSLKFWGLIKAVFSQNNLISLRTIVLITVEEAMKKMKKASGLKIANPKG